MKWEQYSLFELIPQSRASYTSSPNIFGTDYWYPGQETHIFRRVLDRRSVFEPELGVWSCHVTDDNQACTLIDYGNALVRDVAHSLDCNFTLALNMIDVSQDLISELPPVPKTPSSSTDQGTRRVVCAGRRVRPNAAREIQIERPMREVAKLKAERDIFKNRRGLLREGIEREVRFIAKHRGIWRRSGVRGRVSRGVVPAWLT